MRAEGFSCSLDVCYGGLGISKLHFDQKNMKSFFSYKFWSKTPDPDWYSASNAGSGFVIQWTGSGINESGSETLEQSTDLPFLSTISLFQYKSPMKTGCFGFLLLIFSCCWNNVSSQNSYSRHEITQFLKCRRFSSSYFTAGIGLLTSFLKYEALRPISLFTTNR